MVPEKSGITIFFLRKKSGQKQQYSPEHKSLSVMQTRDRHS